MLSVGTKVQIKPLDQLLSEGLLEKRGEILINEDDHFILLRNFKFFTAETTIVAVDDGDIPYFLANGLWVPEWMLNVGKELDVEELLEEAGIKAAEPKNDVKIYINKFTGKPFGKLMVKLINLDEKIAEFSSTRFSRLRRHELVYIANLLMTNGYNVINIDDFNVKELSTYCYNGALDLDV